MPEEKRSNGGESGADQTPPGDLPRAAPLSRAGIAELLSRPVESLDNAKLRTLFETTIKLRDKYRKLTEKTYVKPSRAGPNPTPYAMRRSIRTLYGTSATGAADAASVGAPTDPSEAEHNPPWPLIVDGTLEELRATAQACGSELTLVMTEAGRDPGSIASDLKRANAVAPLLWGFPPAQSWSALVAAGELIGRLPKPEVADGDGPDGPATAGAQGTLVRDAITGLAGLVGCEVVTAYSFDHRLNRTFIVPLNEDPDEPSRGVWYPQTLLGISWFNDKPRLVLEEQSCVPRALEPREFAGTFAERERIHTVWALPVTWRSGKLVLFFSWREGSAPAWRDGLNATGVPRAENLALATFALGGWLQSFAVQIQGERTVLATRNVSDALKKMSEVLGSPRGERGDPEEPGFKDFRSRRTEIRFGRGKVLSDAASTLLSIPPEAVSSIHTHRIISAGEQDERNDSDDPLLFPLEPDADHGERLKFVHGPHIINARQVVGMPEHSLRITKDGLVERSLCAQAATWNTPIVIRDTRAMRGGPTSGTARRTLADLSLPCAVGTTKAPEHTANGCEVAVPIPSEVFKSGVSGVVDLELKQPNKLQREHVVALQVLASLFSSVESIAESERSQGPRPPQREDVESVKGFIATLLLTPHADTRTVLHECCRWVHKELNASLVGVLTYSSEAQMLLPRFCYSQTLPSLPGLPASARPSISDGDVSDVMYRYMVPRRGKVSEHVFKTVRSQAFWNGSRHKDLLNPYMTRCYETMACVPLVSGPRAQPDGVLWVVWESAPSPHLVDEEHAAVDADDELKKIVEARIGRALRVVAAMYALFRLSGRDDAAE